MELGAPVEVAAFATPPLPLAAPAPVPPNATLKEGEDHAPPAAPAAVATRTVTPPTVSYATVAAKPAAKPASSFKPASKPAKPSPPDPAKQVFGTAYPKHSRQGPDRHMVVLHHERVTLEIVPGTLHLFDVGGTVSVRDAASPKWHGTLRSLGVCDVKGVRYYRYSLTTLNQKRHAELLLNRGILAMLRCTDGKPRSAAQLLY